MREGGAREEVPAAPPASMTPGNGGAVPFPRPFCRKVIYFPQAFFPKEIFPVKEKTMGYSPISAKRIRA